MIQIFMSHSSKDKEFVRWLSQSLEEIGYQVWLDEWEIKVGESITGRVQDGLDKSQYLILVLSSSSVESGWVEKEWKAKYWDEIKNKQTIILPVLIEQCNIPTLLKDKRYANFSSNRTKALLELVSGLGGITFPKNEVGPNISEVVKTKNNDALELMKKISNRDIALSSVLPEILAFSREVKDQNLEQLIRGEILGWDKVEKKYIDLKYRYIEAYASFGTINTYSYEWNNDLSNAIRFLRNNKDVKPFFLFLSYSAEWLEREDKKFSEKSIASLQMKESEFSKNPDSLKKDRDVNVYISGDYCKSILNQVRQHFIELLIGYE